MQHIDIYHRDFLRYILPQCPLVRLQSGMAWTEGPVYFADTKTLVWSDSPNHRLMKLDEVSGSVSILRESSEYANGNTRDMQGRLVSCQHATRSITRTEWDGSIVTLVDSYQGRRLNSPNDVVVKSDGTIWFTDPTYGISAEYEGGVAEPEQEKRNVFRFDPRDNSLRSVVEDFAQPNGLAFSPDEKTLYIADSGFWPNPDDPHHIRAFDVAADGSLSGSRVIVDVEPGIPDGLRVDASGNLWISCADGVLCARSTGELIGKIKVPENVANLCFGGERRNRLYICAHTSLYAIYLNTTGAFRP